MTRQMNLDEMWERLAQHQPFADDRCYGPEWARMCEERTEAAARAAAKEAAWEAAEAARAAAAVLGNLAEAKAAEADALYWVEKAEGKK